MSSRPDNVKWNGKKGCYEDEVTKEVARNPEPSYSSASNADIIHAYFTELSMAFIDGGASGKGGYDFSKHNARELVWKLGNHKKLGAIRNLISKFSKQTGNKFVTLRSRVSGKGKTEAQQIAEAKGLFDQMEQSLKISALIQK